MGINAVSHVTTNPPATGDVNKAASEGSPTEEAKESQAEKVAEQSTGEDNNPLSPSPGGVGQNLNIRG